MQTVPWVSFFSGGDAMGSVSNIRFGDKLKTFGDKFLM